jgi:hypothetical protein
MLLYAATFHGKHLLLRCGLMNDGRLGKRPKLVQFNTQHPAFGAVDLGTPMDWAARGAVEHKKNSGSNPKFDEPP